MTLWDESSGRLGKRIRVYGKIRSKFQFFHIWIRIQVSRFRAFWSTGYGKGFRQSIIGYPKRDKDGPGSKLTGLRFANPQFSYLIEFRPIFAILGPNFRLT